MPLHDKQHFFVSLPFVNAESCAQRNIFRQKRKNMCGINGIFSNHKIDNLEARIQKMNQSLAHRGPNANKYSVIANKTALGHRRLSILDLDERSNQPMQLNGGKYILIFNGEIFNYQEIKKQLAADYQFCTESDTEVLLAGIEFKGIDWIIKQANGMFALAAYNTETGETIIARDRLGIKPVFYTVVNETLVVSSEIKGILSSGLVEAVFNEDAIDDYLAYRYVRAPYTFFNDIYQVEPASYIHFDSQLKAEKQIYWQLPPLNFEQKYDADEIISRCDDEVQKAFKRWFIADVRVGAYLSGGVDSSLTTAILSKYANDKKVDTYTIGFGEQGFNEFPYAKAVAEQYHTNHKEILCEQQNYFAEWERLIDFKDAPLGVPNEIPLAQMSTILSKDITVVISGEGADELFGGYGRIFRSAFDFSNTSTEQSFYQYFSNQYEYVSRAIRDKYLCSTTHTLRQHFDAQITADFDAHKNEENIFRFFHSYHIQGLLQRVDMTTMQTSVEARPPFLDHELIEFVYTQIPYDLKLHWNSAEAMQKAQNTTAKQYSEVLDCPKYVLKKVSEKYLPNDIIYRKKMGFPVPLTNWFPQLGDMAKDLLKDSCWLNVNELDNLISELKYNDRAGQLLWMFLNIQLFYNKYFKHSWLW